jgi:hypothetical protein
VTKAVVSESGLIYNYATPSLKPFLESEQGTRSLRRALNGINPIFPAGDFIGPDEDETLAVGGGQGGEERGQDHPDYASDRPIKHVRTTQSSTSLDRNSPSPIHPLATSSHLDNISKLLAASNVVPVQLSPSTPHSALDASLASLTQTKTYYDRARVEPSMSLANYRAHHRTRSPSLEADLEALSGDMLPPERSIRSRGNKAARLREDDPFNEINFTPSSLGRGPLEASSALEVRREGWKQVEQVFLSHTRQVSRSYSPHPADFPLTSKNGAKLQSRSAFTAIQSYTAQLRSHLPFPPIAPTSPLPTRSLLNDLDSTLPKFPLHGAQSTLLLLENECHLMTTLYEIQGTITNVLVGSFFRLPRSPRVSTHSDACLDISLRYPGENQKVLDAEMHFQLFMNYLETQNLLSRSR